MVTRPADLNVFSIMAEFLIKHVRNFMKRIFLQLLFRDMSLASIELPLGLCS